MARMATRKYGTMIRREVTRAWQGGKICQTGDNQSVKRKENKKRARGAQRKDRKMQREM